MRHDKIIDWATLLCVFGLFLISAQVFSQNTGQELYKTNCISCHSIGAGKLVGPDLLGVNERRSEEWLIKWIKSSQSLIKSGDKDAISLFDSYNKIPMTDFNFLTDDNVKAILTYIKEEGMLAQKNNNPVVTAATGTSVIDPPVVNKSAFSPSISEIILLTLVAILLIIIYIMSKLVIKLSDKLGDYYSNDRSTF